MTTRLSSGLAFSPEKDLQLFSDMAARGKKLAGFGALGHDWTFTDAPAEDLIFDLAYEAHPSQDYFDLFIGAGWFPVLSAGDMHIFKAEPGTPPVHTAKESRLEELKTQRNKYAIYSIIAIIIFVLAIQALGAFTGGTWIEASGIWLALVPVIYTVLPFTGYAYRAYRFQ